MSEHTKNHKFVNYSITKYIKFQLKHAFDQCKIKVGFMGTVSEIVLYISMNFFKKMKVLMAICSVVKFNVFCDGLANL